MQNPEFLIDTFLIIFIGMGPIKALLVYVGLTKDADRALQRQVAQKAVVTATVVAMLLLVAGVVFMRLLHFTTSALTNLFVVPTLYLRFAKPHSGASVAD